MDHHRDNEDVAEVLSTVINRSTEHKRRTPRKTYRLSPFGKRLVAGFLFAVICLAAIILSLTVFKKSDSAIKQQLVDYQESSSFTIYEPRKLPEGYKADSADTSMSAGLVFFILKSTGVDKPSITISQQATPSNITADSLYGLSSPEAIDTKNGKLYIGTANDTLNATLVTNNSWILFSAPKSINTEVIKSLASSMEPVR